MWILILPSVMATQIFSRTLPAHRVQTPIVRLNYQFTPDLFTRLFVQYRSATDRLYVYGLFGWRFKVPSSAIYLVYTRENMDRPGLEPDETELFFVKLAYGF